MTTEQIAVEPSAAWRTIDTAPTEGVFLAHAPHSQGGYPLVACRNTEGCVVDTANGFDHPFTHWMPLPAAPVSEGRQ
jgi:hypothetical protein